MHVQTADGHFTDARRTNSFAGGYDGGGTSSWSVGSIPLLGLNAQATYAAIYKSNPWVFAAVKAISLGMSRNSLGVYEWDAKGDRTRQRYDRPGASLGGADLDRKLNGAYGRVGPQKRMRRTVTDFLVRGNALWVEENGGYCHVPWRRVNPLLSADQEILGWQILSSTPGKVRNLAPEEVVHFAGGDDPDSELGVSSISALKYTLQLFEALQRHMVRFFENSARPSGNLKVDKGADLEKMEWMREQFRKLYASPENAGKVIITTGDFQPITTTADQAGIIELVRLSREEIAAVYRIPMPLLGILENAIKSNVQELRAMMTRDTLGGYSAIFEDEIRAQVVDPSPIYAGLFAEWDYDSQLTPDFEALTKTLTDLERTFTTDERRAMFNKPKLGLPESETVATTPGAEFLGIQKNGTDGADGEPTNLNEMTPDQAQVVGTLVRSGYDPAETLRAAGAPAIKHTGLLPVTLKDGKQIEAEAQDAVKKVDEPAPDPAADAATNPSGKDNGDAPANDPAADPAPQPA